MGNVYHVLFKNPALIKEEMYVETEQLAQKLLRSGRLRIEAEDKGNFIRLNLPFIKEMLMLSRRELFDKRLLPNTEKRIAKIVRKRFPHNNGITKARQEIKRLREEIKRYNTVDHETAIKIARIIVQSAEPIVMALLLEEDGEIFVSYGQNIRDMVHTPHWQYHGLTNGMQSTDGYDIAVYTSCNGDPFAEGDYIRHSGDGRPALARMMTILGQELGHYADILRDSNGNQVGRHASNLNVTKATDHVRIGRIRDLKIVMRLEKHLVELGIRNLIEKERNVKFYRSHNASLIIRKPVEQLMKISKKRFYKRCLKEDINFIHHFKNEEYMGSHLIMAIADMKFNLAPVADAYIGKNNQETEAIACVEALARVPQQVIKWGHETTQFMMPYLYEIYYEQVIPACYKAYSNRTGHNFPQNLRKMPVSIFRRIILFLDRILPEP